MNFGVDETIVTNSSALLFAHTRVSRNKFGHHHRLRRRHHHDAQNQFNLPRKIRTVKIKNGVALAAAKKA